MSDKIELTKEELESLIKNNKLIGQGTEGKCFQKGNEIYKIYHKTYESTYAIGKGQLDEDGVRIYNPEEKKQLYVKDERIIKYTDEEGVKLTVQDGLSRALNKGQKITKTRLPSKIIMVDGKVKGCVYPYYRFTSSIYSAIHKPYKTRLKICKRLIDQVKELLDNNIYPVDLCQKGDKRISDKSIANVLLDLRNNPIIIDLEGKSTLYTDKHNETYERTACYNLATVILELLTREDIQEDFIEENIEMITNYLRNAGMNEELVEKYIDSCLNIEDVYTIFDNLSKKR